MSTGTELLCQWYKDVLGTEGSTQIIAQPVAGRTIGKFFHHTEYGDMLAWIKDRNEEHYQMFLTLENFLDFNPAKAHLRKESAHPAIAGRRCIVIDLDLKDSKFKNQIDLAKHAKLVLEHEPHSYVGSGGGVHVYYALDEEINLDEMVAFRTNAMRQFKAAGLAVVDSRFKGAHAFRSLARCPNTINWKPEYDPDYPTSKILGYKSHKYNVEELVDRVEPELLKDIFEGLEPPTRFISGLRTTTIVPCSSLEVSMDDVRKGCPAAERYYALSAKNFNDDGIVGDRDDVAMFANLCYHTVSDYGTPGDRKKEFTTVSGSFPDSTRGYLEQEIWQSFMDGPTMDKPWQCHKWGTGMSVECAGCKHRDTPGFSPWKAGREEFVVPPPEPEVVQKRVEQKAASKMGMYTVDIDGVSFQKKMDDGDVVDVRITASPVKVMYRFDDNAEHKLMLDVAGRKRVVPYRNMAAAQSAASTLQSVGVTVLNNGAASKYIQHATEAAPIKTLYSSFGWMEDKFLTPYEIIGSTEKPDFKWGEKQHAERFGKGIKGSSDEWVKLVHNIDYDQLLDHQCLIMSSFCSPLFELLDGIINTRGFVINLYSTESGSGKSTALKIAQSVFYSPREYAVRFSDTDLSQWDELRRHKSLPVTWDELTITDPDKMTKTVFYTTGGSSRRRMDTSDMKYDEGNFRTFLLTTSNTSLQSLISKSDQAANEAAYYRGIDLNARKLRPNNPAIKSMAFVESEINNLYGTIGTEYLKYIIANKKTIRKEAQRIKDNFSIECDRFTKEWAILMLTSMYCLEGMGRVFFSHDVLETEVMRRVKNAEAVASNAVVGSIELPAEFLQRMSSRIYTNTNASVMPKPVLDQCIANNLTFEDNMRKAVNNRMGNMRIVKRYEHGKGTWEYCIPVQMLREAYADKNQGSNVLKVWRMKFKAVNTTIRVGGSPTRCVVIKSNNDIFPQSYLDDSDDESTV